MKISIEGCIASGKTTLLTKLQQKIRIPIFLEPVDSWTLLNDFYQDITRWGFTFNVEVMLSMEKWKNNDYDSLYERSPNSCRHVFTQMQFEQKQISKKELDLFDIIVKKIGWDQDVIIYIKTDPEICYQRMQTRNRECENKVTLQYLEDVNNKYNDMLNYLSINKPNIKIYTINGNEEPDIIYNNVLELLKKLIIL